MTNCFFVTGVVTSPNYPNNYPANFKRSETIGVGEGQIISLRFTTFEILYSTSWQCELDFLTIKDNNGTTLMDDSCGSSLPTAIFSSTNIVELLFKTGRYFPRWSGWKAIWSTVSLGLKTFFTLYFLCAGLDKLCGCNHVVLSHCEGPQK